MQDKDLSLMHTCGHALEASLQHHVPEMFLGFQDMFGTLRTCLDNAQKHAPIFSLLQYQSWCKIGGLACRRWKIWWMQLGRPRHCMTAVLMRTSLPLLKSLSRSVMLACNAIRLLFDQAEVAHHHCQSVLLQPLFHS